MSSSSQPHNRESRRATATNSSSASKSSGSSFQPTSELTDETVELILQHPDRSGPKGKTLYELADERRRQIRKENPGKYPEIEEEDVRPEGAYPFNDDPIGPFGDAILYSLSLAALHLTLDVIVFSQYREDVVWSEIFIRAGRVIPPFFIAVYLLHVETSIKFPILRNLFFFCASTFAGCYMVWTGNKKGYFHVMKTAPPIGAVWIWSVVEMNLLYAATHVLCVVSYLWWNKFEAF